MCVIVHCSLIFIVHLRGIICELILPIKIHFHTFIMYIHIYSYSLFIYFIFVIHCSLIFMVRCYPMFIIHYSLYIICETSCTLFIVRCTSIFNIEILRHRSYCTSLYAIVRHLHCTSLFAVARHHLRYAPSYIRDGHTSRGTTRSERNVKSRAAS